MSTTALNYPNVIQDRPVQSIRVILMMISLALIASRILVIVFSTTRDTNPVDFVSVVQNSVIPIPIPTPPATVQPISSETPVPSSAVGSEPSVVPVPIPTPPSP